MKARFLLSVFWVLLGLVLCVCHAAGGTIAFQLLSRADLMKLASGGVCLMVTLYWASCLALRRKY